MSLLFYYLEFPKTSRYEILNFQRLPNMTYSYVQIGDWNNGTLAFSSVPQSRVTQLVESVCSKPCDPGSYKVRIHIT